MELQYCWLVVFNAIIWILVPYNCVFATKEWPLPSLEYKVDSKNTPDVIILSVDVQSQITQSRHRRYVPDSLPLDEYIHKERFLNSPTLQENIPTNRQTKDVKFFDGKPASSPQAPVSNNSASRVIIPTLSTPHSTISQSIPVNKSVIISADFDNGMVPGMVTTAKPTDGDLGISKHIDEMIQTTMNQNNITQKQEDSHVYYNSTFIVDYHIGQSYWVDMNKREDVKVNTMLSKSHRRAATVKLSFDFPFYGHLVRNVTIATGGFLYTGEYVHSWLAATQYIAPLMANFDTSMSNDSFIKYVDNGTSFTVQWEKVVLQDKPTCGEFTFQATLHASGDIVFVYQNVPVVIENIQDDQHPVKVGLSDAYIIDRTIFFVRRKTIYEYHRVNFKKEDIKNWTVIYLNALPTCMEKNDCSSCVTADIGFECKWCTGAGRCSTGMDRKRQDWLHNECERLELSTVQQCEEQKVERIHDSSTSAVSSLEIGKMAESQRGGSGYLGAAFILVLVAGVAVWTLYAYSNPHSYSGQILIRYRPSQWSWRRGEARYTAATIHM